MKEFCIDKNSANMRLDKFMLKAMPKIRTGEVYKALRKKKVRVNGKHTDGAHRLSEGDTVCIYMNDEFFGTDAKYPWQGASDDIKVVYEDDNILIADKPSGMPSQDTDLITDSLESRIRSYLYKNNEIDTEKTPLFIPSLCHRIDRNTSGLVIAAKNAEALRIINEKIKNREIRKFYICETEQTPNPPSGRICGWLTRNERDRRTEFSPQKQSGGSVRCETLYKTLRKGSPALVEAELLTGRTHQIRAGFSQLGCPLVGDVKYGARPNGKREYQHLISHKIIFDFKTPSGSLEYLNGKTYSIEG